ncbi:MAG TPA: hypothetical protein VGI64_05965 [Streptosporangiaceae bacterium]|jgi:hypothetical protein
MPVFNNPRRVIVETGGAGNDLLIGLVLAVAVAAGVVWLVEQVAVAILCTLSALTLACTAYLVHVLRRDGLRLWRPGQLPGEQAPARVTARPARPGRVRGRTAPRAIEAPKISPATVALARAISDVNQASARNV